MTNDHQEPVAHGLHDAIAGLRDIAPVIAATLPIGLLFGAVAAAKGLSTVEVTLMSVLVFAGGAQFAAVELWGTPVPIAAVLFSTLLINARLALMSASLGPKLSGFSRVGRYFGLFFLTDESWALAERRSVKHALTPAYWLTLVVLLAAAWIGATALGAAAGPLLGRPERWGADFAFTALFIGLIAGFDRNRITAATVAASAVVAAIAHVTLGAPWHVLAGAAAGILAAYVAARPDDKLSDRRGDDQYAYQGNGQ